jgi:hypothetical protein
MIKYLLLSPISIINCHGSFEIFINPPNLTTNLIVNSTKNVNGKQLWLSWRTIISKVTKMVDLDRSHKCMGWNGHESF